ncbi:MAG: TRAP transporter large permease subunit [Acuticoccus sp.]
MNGLLPFAMFGTLVVLLFTGYPVGLVLGGVGLLYGVIGIATGDFLAIQFYNIVPRMFGGAGENLLLVAVPMFVFMGVVLEKTGAANELLRVLQLLLRRAPGGLALSVVLLGTVLAAMTGIIGASVVMITLLALPTLLAQGYAGPLATGTIAASGTLGILLPPSIMLVIMADLMGASVGSLFLAAIAPGLMLAALYSIYIVAHAMLRPGDAPPPAPSATRDAGNLALLILKSFVPPVALISLVLGSIFFGWATVTEASGIGAAGALVLGLWMRRLDWATLIDALDQSLRTIGMIFLVILGATTFSFVFRALGGDEVVQHLIEEVGAGRWAIIASFMLAIFVLGFFFDWTEIVLIVLPVILPAFALLDFSDHVGGRRDVTVWFAMLVAINLQTSFLTPPFGFALFYLKGTAPPDLSVGTIYRGIIPFVLLQLLALAIIIVFPEVALWLPNAVLR